MLLLDGALTGSPVLIGETIDELIVDAGGVGQTRTISDMNHPGASGGVTWVASDPLTGVDPGGKARWWARYPDGSGGFWRRDDWFALTVGVGKANAISLDWAGLDDNEDISPIIQELLDQYTNGAAGNICSIKGPEDVGNISVGGIARTGDQTATAWYWYAPTTNKCTVRTKPWALGTENLIGKTYSGLGSNRWSTSVGETVKHLRCADPSVKSSPNAYLGPWLVGMNLEASAAAVNGPREWFYGTGTLTVYATSDPSTYFTPGSSSSLPGMQYVTDVTDLDNHGILTDFHKVYIEGGGSFFHSNAGLEFRGRAGYEPWGGGGNIVAGGNERTKQTGWVFLYNNSGFTRAGSFVTLLAGMSGYLGSAIQFQELSANHQVLEKVTIGGIHASQIRPSEQDGTTMISSWWHFLKDGEAGGEEYRQIKLWGEFIGGHDGSVSESGATDDVGNTNMATTKQWGFQGNNRFINLEKITGHGSGMNALGFIGRKGNPSPVQFGESLADPYVIEMAGNTVGVGGDYATFMPNGRPVFYDNNQSFEYQFGKSDVYYSVRGGSNFLHIYNPGIVDPFTGAALNIDVRAKAGSDVLNVEADPAALDLGMRNALCTFEATLPGEPGGYAGTNLKISGAGQGTVKFGDVDFRYPYNYTGYWTIHGINDDCHMKLTQIATDTTIDDFNFVDMYDSAIHKPEEAITFHTETNFERPDNIVLTNVAFRGNRIMPIGVDTGPFGGATIPPYRVFLNDCIVTGDASKNVIPIIPYVNRTGRFNKGHPIVIQANNTDSWDAGITIDIPGVEDGDDVYFSDDGGTTWYEPGWIKGGTNTTKSAPPDLVTLCPAWRPFRGTLAKVYMPQFFHDGNHCTVVLYFDGDPGTITPPAGFTLVSAASANLSDNSLYVRVFEGTFANGKDLWDESKLEPLNNDSVKPTFSWTGGTRAGWSYSIEHTGQNATPIGDADSTAHNTASTTHTAPTLTVSANSKILSFIGMRGDAKVSDFAGALSPWTSHILYEDTVHGVMENDAGADGAPSDVDTSMCAASVYSGASGSKGGCAYTIDASLKAITTSIEIKT